MNGYGRAMTPERLHEVTTDSDSIGYQARMETLAQIVRITGAALGVADKEPIYVALDADNKASVQCAICGYTSPTNATIRHREECAWFQLSLAVSGDG